MDELINLITLKKTVNSNNWFSLAKLLEMNKINDRKIPSSNFLKEPTFKQKILKPWNKFESSFNIHVKSIQLESECSYLPLLALDHVDEVRIPRK